MRKNPIKSLAKKVVPAVALGLSYFANPSSVDAQQCRNYVDSGIQENSATGEGVFLKKFVYDFKDNRKTDLDLDGEFKLSARHGGPVRYEVIQHREGLENVISYLRNNGQMTDERRASIDYLEGLVNVVEYIGKDDPQSIAALREAVRDGNITAEEMTQINQNTYVILAKTNNVTRSDGVTCTNETLPILVYLPTDAPNANRPGIAEVPREPTPVERYVPRERTERHPEPRHEPRKGRRPEARLTLDGFAGDNELIGGSVGVGYGPLGVSVGYSEAGDVNVKNVNVPLPNGRQAVGREDETNYRAISVSGELHPSRYFFVGGGANVGSLTRVVDENIVSEEGEILKPATNSRSESETSGRFYGGFNIPVHERLALRAFGGYDTRNGAFAGGGLSIRLNKSHRTQHRR